MLAAGGGDLGRYDLDAELVAQVVDACGQPEASAELQGLQRCDGLALAHVCEDCGALALGLAGLEFFVGVHFIIVF